MDKKTYYTGCALTGLISDPVSNQMTFEIIVKRAKEIGQMMLGSDCSGCEYGNAGAYKDYCLKCVRCEYIKDKYTKKETNEKATDALKDVKFELHETKEMDDSILHPIEDSSDKPEPTQAYNEDESKTCNSCEHQETDTCNRCSGYSLYKKGDILDNITISGLRVTLSRDGKTEFDSMSTSRETAVKLYARYYNVLHNQNNSFKHENDLTLAELKDNDLNLVE